MARVLTNKVETIGKINFEYWQWKQITYVYWDMSTAGMTPTVVVEIYYGHTDTVKHSLMSIYTTTVTVDGTTKDNGDDFSLNVSCEPGEWQLMQTFEFPLSYTPEDNKTVATKHSGHFAGYTVETKTTNVELKAPEYSYVFTNTDKLALEQNTAAIKCKLIVKATDTLPEIILTEDDSIKDWVYTDDRYVPKQGFIGQFVARTLEGNLQNISDDFNIENRELELLLGIVNQGNTNWYNLGNFIVTNPEDDEVKDNTKFEAMDYTKLLNERFNGEYTDSTYTRSYTKIIESGEAVTALWLAKYACAQAGIEFPQTAFTNSDFEIKQNPFQAGESCRDVLKEIAKLAYSWVRIGWDNKCYIDFDTQNNTVDTYNIIDNNQYYTLETKKTVYGPINNVVVGMAGIDGESHSVKDKPSIEQYGEHTIYIYDNPLTNTFDLRELAQQQAHKLFGLTYVHMEVETVGHPWLQGNERINVLNMEGNDNYTYPFNRSIDYTGHIRTTLNSMGDSETEATLAYESDVIKNIRNASITVDKQNGKITALVEDIEEANGIVNERINTLEMTATSTTSRIESVEKSVTDLGDSVDDKLALISDDIDEVQINLDDFKENEYVQGISNLQKQIDGAIQFWNGPDIPTLTNYPANQWTTENDRINHQADIYTVIEDVDGELKQGKSYRFDKVNGTWVWIELTDNELSAVQALAQDALNKAKANEGKIVTLTSDVSELKQTDDEIKASVDSIENTLVPLADASGSYITLTDSTDASLIKFQLEGKSEQNTRDGKNLITSIVKGSNNSTVSGNSITFDFTQDIDTYARVYFPKEVGKTYTFVFDGTGLPDGERVRFYLDNDSSVNYLFKNGKNVWVEYANADNGSFVVDDMSRAEISSAITMSNIMVLEGSYTEDNVPPYEEPGVSPSPDYPSEIKSVGYENEFDSEDWYNTLSAISVNMQKETVDGIEYYKFRPNGIYTYEWMKGQFEENTQYTISAKARKYDNVEQSSTGFRIKYTDGTNNYVMVANTLTEYDYVFTSDPGKTIDYIYLAYNYNNYVLMRDIQIVKGALKKSYIPHGKYGIEVKTIADNLLDYTINLDGSLGTASFLMAELELYPGTYTLSLSPSLPSAYGYLYIGAGGSIATNIRDSKTFTITSKQIIPFRFVRQSGTYNNETFNVMLNDGASAKPYKPYKEKVTTMVLNEPLRSLPNGVKDIAYIKNNKLYVDRKVGSLVLNGTETWTMNDGGLSSSVNKYFICSDTKNIGVNASRVFSNYFENKSIYSVDNIGIAYEGSDTSHSVRIRANKTSLEEFKTWLSTHNTQVDYELAEPYTEDYGDIKYPVTYKNVTHILTTDNLEPNMNITYVREGSMTDYIEGQFTEKDIVQNRKFSELSVKADSISATVTSVEGDLAETNTQINKLEAKLTDQEATITIVSSHINKDTNTLRVSEVTTTNGFTFNAEGLNIYTDENSYNTQINNTGTFYKDGDEVIGKTTKDGSLLKNLSLQGQTNYSYDGDSYDFIEERVYTDGEYCYATFYNGEG